MSADLIARLDDLVVERLVVALCMIMRQELPNSVAKHVLPEENQSRKALVLDASDEPFDVRIQIRRPWRKLHGFHTLTFEYPAESIGELRVAIHDQETLTVEAFPGSGK